MPALRFSHIPTRFASEGRLTNSVGLSNPSTRQRHPRYPGSRNRVGSLSLAVASVGATLAVSLRDGSLRCHKQVETASG
jgi:hypothetical protein